MKNLLRAGASAFALLLLASPALAQTHNGPIYQTTNDPAVINIATATTTELVAASGSKTVYVTSGLVYAGGTGNITFRAGTGTNCGTGGRSLSGPIPLKDQGGFLVGTGLGVSLRLRAGEALCALTDAAVQISGWLMYERR